MKKMLIYINLILVFLLAGCLFNQDELDYHSLINEVSLIQIKSNVEVINTKFGLGSSKSQGSGIIFYETEDTFYVLTNNHVVYLERIYRTQKFEIIDYKGEAHDATLEENSGYKEFDLAILKFSKTANMDLLSTKLASSDIKTNEVIIALGSPLSQQNFISLGYVSAFQKAPDVENGNKEIVDISFSVIAHNAPINSGSSGGALLNTNLEIVGINYLGSYDDNNAFQAAFAIPVSEIHKYLKNFVLE